MLAADVLPHPRTVTPSCPITLTKIWADCLDSSILDYLGFINPLFNHVSHGGFIPALALPGKGLRQSPVVFIY